MVDSLRDTARHDGPGTPRWVKALGAGIVVAVLLVAVVMLMAGGQHGPGLHTGATGASEPEPAASIPVGAGVGGPVDAGEATRTIAVSTLDAMAFEPSSVDVSAGEAVTFVVTNEGQSVHEFTLGNTSMQQEHADAMAHMPSGMPHELPNSITLQPGESKRLTWRFGHSGMLEYACHEPGHYDGGMRGHLTVS